MVQNKIYDVFISYSHEDKRIADEICAALTRHGISFFIDKEEIPPGGTLNKIIAQAIIDSSVFLLLGSKSSYASKNVSKEIAFAQRKAEQGMIEILPYRIDDTKYPPEIDFAIGGMVWRDRSETPFDPDMVDVILQKLGRASVKPSFSNATVPTEPQWKKFLYKYKFLIGVLSALVFVIAMVNLFGNQKPELQKTREVALSRDVKMSLVLIEGNGDPYYLGQTTVTYRQWYAMMQDSLPSDAQADLPKTWIYWDDCLLFAAQLSEKTGLCFSLPTIEEWSYAAKADNRTRLCGSDNLNDVAWYSLNSDNHAHSVGQKKPNAWGLYDMLGNVWEFCCDSIQNYNNQRTKGHRVCGGGFETAARFCLPDGEGLNRYNDFTRKIANKSPYHGFRLKMEPGRKDFKQFADSLRNVVKERKKIQ